MRSDLVRGMRGRLWIAEAGKSAYKSPRYCLIILLIRIICEVIFPDQPTMHAQKSLFLLMLCNTLLVPVIALKYSYNATTAVESAAAFLLLLGTTAGLGFSWLRQAHPPLPAGAAQGAGRSAATGFGLLVGMLWAVEIGINNFIAPPLPARDTIDNLLWAAIAGLILLGSLVAAFRAGRFQAGVAFGGWSGLASGGVACSMALAVVVFGMHFLLHDPLNQAEWAARLPGETAPSMAAYFAYQTLAGALLHLIVLGGGMGLVLGLVGGGVKRILDFRLANSTTRA